MLECKDILFTYANGKGVFSIDFALRNPGLVALIGRNGSGKTTLLNILAGVIASKSGTMQAFGTTIDPTVEVQYKAKVAYCPADKLLVENLTIRENYELISFLRSGNKHAWKECMPWIDRFEAAQFLDTDACELSAGQLRRCMVLTGLFGDPKVIILDEPGNDLDIEGLFVLKDMLKELSVTKAVLVSTHIIDVVRNTPLRAVFMEAGRIVLDSELPAQNDLETLYRDLIWSKE